MTARYLSQFSNFSHTGNTDGKDALSEFSAQESWKNDMMEDEIALLDPLGRMFILMGAWISAWFCGHCTTKIFLITKAFQASIQTMLKQVWTTEQMLAATNTYVYSVIQSSTKMFSN